MMLDLEDEMRSVNELLCRQIAVMLILCLVVPACAPGSAVAQEPQIASKAPAAVAEDPLPDSPQPAGQSQQPATSPSGGAEGQDPSHKPVGTAAAPYERTTGVAASRPAGAAIAPAKQRRVRTILISLGVIAGAGIAVGSVAALSHGSPSRP
jgi:hypothetical protein